MVHPGHLVGPLPVVLSGSAPLCGRTHRHIHSSGGLEDTSVSSEVLEADEDMSGGLVTCTELYAPILLFLGLDELIFFENLNHEDK